MKLGIGDILKYLVLKDTRLEKKTHVKHFTISTAVVQNLGSTYSLATTILYTLFLHTWRENGRGLSYPVAF